MGGGEDNYSGPESNLDEIFLTKLLLHGDSKYKNNVNKKILLASINFILSSKRFEGQLM